MSSKQKEYLITSPVGNIVVPKDIMNESELREFLPQLVQNSEDAQTWKDTSKNQPIETIINYFIQAGYKIEEKHGKN